MRINTPDVIRIVDDYDFIFSSGQVLPVTIDKEQGDTVEFTKDGVTILLTAKRSLHDPDKLLPAEDITIFTKHLITVQHRKREVVELTPDQKAEWTKTFKDQTIQ